MGRMTGTASDEIEAPISEVWAVVEDVESAPDWQGGMESLTVLERDDEGRAELVETESDASVRTVKSTVRFEYEPERRLTWTQEKGDLKSVVGSWELEDIGDGRTRVTYSLDGDPGRVLGMLIRGPVEGKIREILVEGRPGELKDRVEKG
jgi:carbon monoxide dehydrogenase subunit G